MREYIFPNDSYPSDIRDPAFDRYVASYFKEKGIAFEWHPKVSYTNYIGDTDYHTATFRIPATGAIIDIFSQIHYILPSQWITKDVQDQQNYAATHPTQFDVFSDFIGATADVAARIQFQYQASLIPQPLRLVFTNPLKRLAGSYKVAGRRAQLRDFGDGLVRPGIDPVFDWGFPFAKPQGAGTTGWYKPEWIGLA
jgi:hypothetical protein